ncbi:MAG TPA: glycosyltransferase family 39 protein, partial [Patescibacteria group bacterium]
MIKNTKKYWYSVLVVFILIIGFLVRWWNIDKSPASVGYDEAALGYNAYSILKTGKDEYGTFLPLTLRSFNDFKPALYSYLSIPFVAIMGLTAESTRMVSILAGTVSLIFLYLLLRRFVGNKYYCLFLLFIFTFEPWGLHYSRTAFETNLSAAFFISAMWLMFKFSEKKINLKHVATMLILLAMSIYSYHSARVAAPAIILLWALDPLTWLYEKNFIKTAIGSVAKNKNKVAVLMVLILLSVPIFLAGNSSLVLTRLKQENVFERYYPFAPKELISGNPLLSWKSNPIYYLGGMLSGRLMSNVSPVNLSQRIFDWVKLSAQSTADLGVFGWIEGILFAVGLVN